MVKKYGLFIGGEFIPGENKEYYPILNPSNKSKLAEVTYGNINDTKKAVDIARETFDKGVWSDLTPQARSNILLKLADLLEKQTNEFAKLESANVGKTIKFAREGDLFLIIDNLRYFATAARNLEGKNFGDYSGLGYSIIKREPLGVVAGIVPWNYPLLLATWKLAPALAAGNSIIIKPASLTPLTLLELCNLAKKAGIPDGVLNVITGPGEIIGTELACNKKIDMISLTGDVETGKKIMEMSSSTLKKVHLELGGKAPMIILDDCDLKTAVEGAVVGSFWNSGQDCTAVTRIFVHESMHDKFVKYMTEKTKTIIIGDQLKESTDMGPLVSSTQRKRVLDYIESGKKEGAKLVCGGKVPENKNLANGYFLTPGIFTEVHSDMRIAKEEIFGPMAVIFKYKNLDETLKIANNVKYGLASSVWGKDINKLLKIASELNFGTVWINDHGILVSEMPHGGFKQSGFGKDLSMYSLEEYTRVKHIYIDKTNVARKPWHWTVYGKKD
ncbi:aldehyde dehydrogenase [Candidatus Woesearchaeota archaeon]|nr:aldehyde dehydrogenase [Candidatus Woesearchaeota archaeon]